MTANEILRRIRKKVNMQEAGGRFDDTLDILAVMNMIQDEIVNESNCIKGRKYVTTSANDEIISLSKDDNNDNLDILGFPYLITLDDGSANKRLKQVSIEWLDKNNPNWRALTTGKPYQCYPIEEGVGLVPKCDGAYTVRFYFTKKPTALTLSDSSIPFNNITQLYPYHKLIIYGSAYEILSEMPETTMARKDEMFLLYKKGVEKLKNDVLLWHKSVDMTFGLPNRVLISEDGGSDVSIDFND